MVQPDLMSTPLSAGDDGVTLLPRYRAGVRETVAAGAAGQDALRRYHMPRTSIVHGMLHLLGYDHGDDVPRGRGRWKRRETSVLGRIGRRRIPYA